MNEVNNGSYLQHSQFQFSVSLTDKWFQRQNYQWILIVLHAAAVEFSILVFLKVPNMGPHMEPLLQAVCSMKPRAFQHT